MCAIIDKSVVHRAFGNKCTEAGKLFRKWIHKGHGRLVVGGKVKKELTENNNFKDWLREAERSKLVKLVDDDKVYRRAAVILEDGLCKSDDWHVIALAQISGARLLYANDGNLEQDFDNKRLIDKPRGKVYPEDDRQNQTARTDKHQLWEFLNQRDLCKKADK